MSGNIKCRWISTTPQKQWEEIWTENEQEGEDTLEINGVRYQTVLGLGGCFNELGWIALSYLNEKERKKVMTELFDPVKGCRFNFCRMPIGANDYSTEWYSYNEHAGDYNMEKFSIEQDRLHLLPFIKEAIKIRPDLMMFGSPWSPPTWMKFPKAHNYGKMIWKKEVLEAYALYFAKYVKAYKVEDIKIHQVHIQNEPYHDQKWPSCVWTAEQMRDFIRDYLGPAFEKNGLDTEIWLGTMNYGKYDESVHTVLSDAQARKYIAGVGFQWDGKFMIGKTYESWPEMRLMQTENECRDGANSWDDAKYIFDLFRHYFVNGVESYIYWNMVLEPGGMSTWGWKQNSMLTVDPVTKSVIYNPEFYVMKHFSHFVSKGAVRLGLKGHWTANAVAFENPNGEVVYIVGNPFNESRKLTISHSGEQYVFNLKANSFNTIVL